MLRCLERHSLLLHIMCSSFSIETALHLAHIGHPLVGDLLYGGDERKFIRWQLDQPVELDDGVVAGRHLLHAESITLPLPGDERERLVDGGGVASSSISTSIPSPTGPSATSPATDPTAVPTTAAAAAAAATAAVAGPSPWPHLARSTCEAARQSGSVGRVCHAPRWR